MHEKTVDYILDRVKLNSAGCLEWQRGMFPSGYGTVKHGGKQWRTHRLMYKLAFGIDPGGLRVRHLCHNKRCCYPGHLALGTDKENVADSMRIGRHAHGERQGLAKLTANEVREIRADMA